jgi:hypothetical protein
MVSQQRPAIVNFCKAAVSQPSLTPQSEGTKAQDQLAQMNVFRLY